MSDQILTERIIDDKKDGLLDYKWLIRLYLSKNKKTIKDALIDGNGHISADKHSLEFLLDEAVSPFLYVLSHKNDIAKDKSLRAIVQLCTDIHLVYNVNFRDNQLDYLSHLFNSLVESDRVLLMCYDCGTVARGIFFQLINAYRGKFLIRDDEIDRIKNEYYMDKYLPDKAISIFRNNVHDIKKNCLYMCALQLGDKFGHIYLIEKIYIDGKPRYRLYQSCHQSYLLIDYIEYMDYASHPNQGIDIDQHIDDMYHLMMTEKWDQHDIKLFTQWFHFYPMGRILPSDIKRFSSTYIVY